MSSHSYRKSSTDRKKRSSTPSLPEKNPALLYTWGKSSTPQTSKKKVTILETNKEKTNNFFPGENHTFILKQTTIYGFGDNSQNQISEKKSDFSIPKIIRLKILIKKISMGVDFTFITDEKKKVYSFGLNIKGQLGQNHEKNISAPTLIPSICPISSKTRNSESVLNSDEYVAEIACGSLHSILRTNHGRIFSCGFGETYALGHCNNTSYNFFREMTYFSEKYGKKKFKIDKIEAGVSHSGVIISKTLFVWGLYGHPKHSKIAKNPVKIVLKSECKDVCMGDFLTVVLTAKGNVFCFGENFCGQLGNGEKCVNSISNLARVKFDVSIDYITAGLNHCFAVNIGKGKIYAFGSNMENQIDPYSGKECYYFPQEIQFVENIISLKCKGNNTYCITKTKPKTQQKSEKTESSRYINIQKNLDTLSRKNKLLTNENSKLKSEIKNLNLKITESTNSEKNEISKSNYNTNDEINDVIKQFKKQLKKDKTLKPYFEIDFKEIEILNHIAEGGFGVIYKAKWRETIVAVKVLKPELMKEETIKDFLCKIKRRMFSNGIPTSPKHSNVPRCMH